MARLNVNQLVLGEEFGSKRKVRKFKKFKDDIFENSNNRKQYKNIQ
jgi:hypothetical protein